MILCTICARGGSKRLPGKNIKTLLGKPLIAYSIEQAKKSGLFDAIVVSSDSDRILAVAKKYGALPIKRPDALATDESGKVPAIAHAVREAEKKAGKHYDIIVDLSATSPLRTVKDIKGAVQMLKKTGCKSVITGTPAHCSPYFSLVECDAKGVARVSKRLPRGKKILRGQDSPPCFDMNGSIYVWKRDALLKRPQVFYDDTRLYEMPRMPSVDIDEAEDFALVEFLMRRSKR